MTEQEYKRLLEEIRDVYFLLQDGKVILFSGRLVALCGYKHDELIGSQFIDLIAPENRQQVIQLHRDRLTGNHAPEQYETNILTKEGAIMPVELSIWLTEYRGKPAVAGIAVDTSGRRKQEGEIIKAQEEVWRQLARMLHDDTIQELLLVTHRLKDVATDHHGHLPGLAKKELLDITHLVERIINETRDFTQELRPAILDDMGLVPGLKWLAGRLTATGKISAEARILGDERRLPPETELALFRIAQEALNNVRKHAGGSVALVTLEFQENKVIMSVSDNGKGFEATAPLSHFVSQSKLGLLGMYERARLLDGICKVESTPGKGTVVTVEVPIKSTANSVNKVH
jgi:PAS domain S-box-containing protein